MSIFKRGTFLKYHLNSVTQFSFFFQCKPPLVFPCYLSSYLYYCTQQFPQKKFYANENNFARKIMENISGYNLMVFNRSDCVIPDKRQDAQIDLNAYQLDVPIEELFKLLEAAVYLNNQTSDDIYKIFDAVKMRCHEMNDDQLAGVLRILKHSAIFESQKFDRLSDLWKEIEKVCLERWKTWTLPKVFYFIDLWYTLGLLKKSDFVFYITSKLTKKPTRLSPQQVVQLLFYRNILRNGTKGISMFYLECHLEECITKLSLEEIGVAVMGFFKTKNIIHSEKIINHIIDKTINEINTVPEIPLACILKVLRYSTNVKFWGRIPELLNAVEPELSRLTILCSLHASLLTTKGHILHEGVLRKVSQKLVDNITTCRLKDMEKVVFPLAQLNFNPETEPCIYQLVLSELNKEGRKPEIAEFPKVFIALIHYLCLKGIYDENLIKKALDMEFIHHAYGKDKFMFGREVLYIDTTVELECPSYMGPRLPVKYRNYLSKRYSEFLPRLNGKMSKHQILHTQVKEIAETIFGKENIVEKYLLPNHRRADIVVSLDNDQQPAPLDSDLKMREHFTGPIKAPDGSNYYALVVGSINMFLYKSQALNGETISKLKHLRLLGYTPILVSFDDWPSKDTLEKIIHLKTLISLAKTKAVTSRITSQV